MNAVDESVLPPAALGRETEGAMALRLAHAVNALRALSSGQVDAIITPDGKTHLLTPTAEDVRETEKRLRALIESAADIIVVIDRAGRVIFQNRTTTNWAGEGTGSILGRDLFQMVHPDDLLSLYSAFFNVAEEFREDALVQFRLRQQVENYREIEATVGKLRVGPASQIILICRDVARRKAPLRFVADADPGARSLFTASPPE